MTVLRSTRARQGLQMSDENIDYDKSGDEFITFVSKLADGNRKRQLRREIERREESSRIRDSLGLDNFELLEI